MLVGICAAREGVSPLVYWHTRTPREFSVGIRAWIESWQLPARLLLGGGEKSRGDGRRGGQGPTAAPERATPRGNPLLRPRRDRHGRAVKQNVYDLRELLPLDKSWSPDNVQMLKKTTGTLLSRTRR